MNTLFENRWLNEIQFLLMVCVSQWTSAAVRSLAKHIASDAKAKLAIERALNDPDWIIRREAYVALLNK